MMSSVDMGQTGQEDAREGGRGAEGGEEGK